MNKLNKLTVMEYLNEAFDALDKKETRKVLDHISEVMEIVEDDDSIPISWIRLYMYRKGNEKVIKPLGDMINEWRRNNGQ